MSTSISDNESFAQDGESGHGICPVKECNASIDLQLVSADGVRIGAHQFNLEQFSEGFPFAGSTISVDEPVVLEETADVLRLMLQYMHTTRQPDLNDIPFTLLAGLAEAAEKYLVYSAMEICKVYMSMAFDDHPIEVFMYSAKHDYRQLANKAALRTVGVSTSDFEAHAKGYEGVVFQWYRYQRRWSDLLLQTIMVEPIYSSMLHKGGSGTCAAWPPFHFNVLMELKGDLGALQRFSDIVSRNSDMLTGCPHCYRRCQRWREEVESKVAAIPHYSDV